MPGKARNTRLERADYSAMIEAAGKAAGKAYSPYSSVRVGAAVLASSGRIFTGCNVENASLGLTVCAERVAIQNAAAAGEREILAVAVLSPEIGHITPCGACRQVMAEFRPQKGDLQVIMESEDGPRAVPLSKLLPEEFRGRFRPEADL